MNNLTIAAIDVGSTAIRMEIAEVLADGTLRSLESLSKGVSLGKDSFTLGHLSEETIRMACRVLSDYSRLMKSYNVTRYRAVATSAVREASNADLFLDRAYMRSGVDVQVIDGAEQNRLTYLAIHDALGGILDLRTQNVLIVEIGGGSTDISLLQSEEPVYSSTFALGSVRLHQGMLEVEGDYKQRLKFLDRQIRNEMKTITNTIPLEQGTEMVALGGDMRFAARQIHEASITSSSLEHWILDRKEFSKFCTDISKYEPDDLVRKYGIGYAEAETLVPSLFAYRSLAEKTRAERIYVLGLSIRAGLLGDMARQESGQGDRFDRQVIASAKALARKYHAMEAHAEQVCRMALDLFDQLKPEHGLGGKERLLLEVAGILHDVGSFISNRSHHKHTYYIISSSDVFGLSRDDVNIVANVARYHRKSPPTRAHLNYVSLDRESRVIVSKLAAILRIADSLEQDEGAKVRKLHIWRDEENERFILEAEADGDLTMERMSLDAKQDMFAEIYGLPIVLRQVERLE